MMSFIVLTFKRLIIYKKNWQNMRKKALLLYIFLGIEIYKLIVYKCAAKRNRKLLQQIQELKFFSISSLKQRIKKGVHRIGGLALFQGKITSSQPLKSILNPKLEVAYSQLIMDKTLQIGRRTNSIRKRIHNLYASYMYLSDGSGKLKILQTAKARIFTPNFMTKNKNIKLKIFNFNWIFDFFLRSPTRTVQLTYTQSFIPNNSTNVVLGNTFLDSQGNLQLVRPKSIAPTKQIIIGYYISKIAYYQISSLAIVLLMMITSYFLYHLDIKKRIKKLNEQQTQTKIKKVEVKQRLCMRCNKNLSSLIHTSCLHMALCEECVAVKVKSICEICFRNSKETIQVYPS